MCRSTHQKIVEADTFRIERNELCGAPANTTGWRDMGEVYSATLSNVREVVGGQEYLYYTFGDASTDKWSSEYRFRIPPLAGHQYGSKPTSVDYEN